MTKAVNVLMLLFIAALAALLAQPSSTAHPAGTFYPNKWDRNAVVNHRTGDTTPTGGWRDAARHGFGKWSDRAGGAAPEFVFKGTFSGGGHTAHPSTCSIPQGRVYSREDLAASYGLPSESVGGRTFHCIEGPPTGIQKITQFAIVYERTAEPGGWYTGTNKPPNNRHDLRSTSSHEVGHATGFYGHFARNGALCPNNNTRHTMCQGQPAGRKWRRTLEQHDKHTINNAY